MADASDFPPVSIKASPKFKLRDLNLFPQPLNLEKVQLTRNGRSAMGIVGSALKYPNKKNVILIPAYHCPALVEPFIHLDFEIRFYPIEADLNVNLSKFESFLTEDVTHCIVIRYFGFKQNVGDIIQIAKQANIRIIEDCAHALFNFLGYEKPESHQVDAKICSVNKLLPSIDGGALFLNSKPRNMSLENCGWVEELKAGLFIIGITKLLNKFRNRSKSANNYSNEIIQPSESQSSLKYFVPKDMESSGFRHTKLILTHSNLDKIVNKRRHNFDYLLAGLKTSKIGKPLYLERENNIPYVFPFLLNCDSHFKALRKMGIQVLRWEEVAISDCVVSQDYRNRLVQLPCHQSLRREELETMIQVINSMENS